MLTVQNGVTSMLMNHTSSLASSSSISVTGGSIRLLNNLYNKKNSLKSTTSSTSSVSHKQQQQQQLFTYKDTIYHNSQSIVETPSIYNQYINNNNINNYTKRHLFNSSKPQFDQVLRKFVTDDQEEIFKKNVILLEAIQKELGEFTATKGQNQLKQQIVESLEQLKDSLFLLVIVGEFNSGKSSFLNALLGNTYLKEGITPTTSKINLLSFGEKQKTTSKNEEEDSIELPVQWLKDIGLVDTPGTNAVIRSHQAITEHFVPRADMILFVTSVDRAFSESERKFLETIKQWKKKIVVVLSKADLVEANPLATDPKAELEEVKKFVSENFKALLGVSPVIFPVSSKMALKAKLTVSKDTNSVSGDQFQNKLASNDTWKTSKFSDLEKYILQTLDSKERARLKLSNPLGVAENVLSVMTEEMTQRSKVLSDDNRTLTTVEQQLAVYREEMSKDLEFHLQRIDNVLLKMETRADAFLDDQIQITNLIKLLRSDEVKLKFEKEVVGTTTHEIESNTSALIDWMVEKNSRQWRDIMDYIDNRSHSRLERLIGTVNRSGDFLANRKALLDSVGESTSRTLAAYDKDKESTKISQEIRTTIFRTAAIEVGAVGLGTLLTASLLDLSGIIGIGLLAVGGLALLPLKKTTLKKSVHTKISDLRTNLANIMRVHFEQELESGIQKMKDGISPFSTYVNLENKKLQTSQEKVKEFTNTISNIKKDIDRL